jgi:hypothetical protein
MHGIIKKNRERIVSIRLPNTNTYLTANMKINISCLEKKKQQQQQH